LGEKGYNTAGAIDEWKERRERERPCELAKKKKTTGGKKGTCKRDEQPDWAK